MYSYAKLQDFTWNVLMCIEDIFYSYNRSIHKKNLHDNLNNLFIHSYNNTVVRDTPFMLLAQSAGAIEYTDCTSAEG